MAQDGEELPVVGITYKNQVLSLQQHTAGELGGPQCRLADGCAGGA